MAKKSKKYLEAAKKIDSSKAYPVQEAIALAKETDFAKFDASVEVAYRLGLDPKKADQQLRGAVVLPNGTGKTQRVLVFAKGEKAKEAEKLAKMNKDQKNEYEMEKLRKENEELRQREAMNSMRNEARSMFGEKNITATDELLDIVVTTEAESTQKNIDALTNVINNIVKEQVKESLRNGAPKNVKSGGMTREDIMNIKDSDERQMAIVQNRHLFK